MDQEVAERETPRIVTDGLLALGRASRIRIRMSQRALKQVSRSSAM